MRPLRMSQREILPKWNDPPTGLMQEKDGRSNKNDDECQSMAC